MSLCILAIETATAVCSAALHYNNQILSREITAPKQQHSELILPMLEALLAEAGVARSKLDAIAFSCGPGNFTGVRLATSIAQAMAFALNISVVPISTLRSLAQHAFRLGGHKHVLSALDARLRQIYWGFYTANTSGIMGLCPTEVVCDPNHIILPKAFNQSQWVGIGSGWDQYTNLLAHAFSTHTWLEAQHPKAYDIALLAQHDYYNGYQVDPLSVMPVYLRNKVVQAVKPLN